MKKQRTKQIASTMILQNCDAKNSAVVPKTATNIAMILNNFFDPITSSLFLVIYFDTCFLLQLLKDM